METTAVLADAAAAESMSDVSEPATVIQVAHANPDVLNIWDRLRAAGFNMLAEFCFKDYCTVENEVSVNELMSDEDITQSVSASASAPGPSEPYDENDIDDSTERQPVTRSESMTLCQSCVNGWRPTVRRTDKTVSLL